MALPWSEFLPDGWPPLPPPSPSADVHLGVSYGGGGGYLVTQASVLKALCQENPGWRGGAASARCCSHTRTLNRGFASTG